MREPQLLSLIDAVYEASLQPGRWTEALGQLSEAFDATAAGVRIQNGTHVSQFWIGLDESFERAYLGHYALNDPWIPAALSRPAGRCYTSQELVPDDELEASAFYNELCKPYGMRELCGGLLERGDKLLVSLSVMRRDGAPRFDAEASRSLDTITPHVRRALAVQRRLRTSEGASTWSMLDLLSVAVITIDRSGRIHRANRRAEELFAKNEGLVSRAGRLDAVDPAESRKLAAMVHGLVEPTANQGARDPVLRVTRPGGKRPLAIVGIRITRRSAPAWELDHGGEPEVLLAVAADDDAAGPSAELLRRLYGLTPAEARVALHVGLGKSPREVADELGIAWNTVRFQLRQVFDKLGVHRQSELTRVLLSLESLPALDRPR